jgi:hypothetical protein
MDRHALRLRHSGVGTIIFSFLFSVFLISLEFFRLVMGFEWEAGECEWDFWMVQGILTMPSFLLLSSPPPGESSADLDVISLLQVYDGSGGRGCVI